jgi:hypothetical protein
LGTGWSVGAGAWDGQLGQGYGMVRWGRGTGWSVGAGAWDGPLGQGHGWSVGAGARDGPLGQGVQNALLGRGVFFLD